MRKNQNRIVGAVALVASILTIATAMAQESLPTILKSKTTLDDPVERLPAVEPSLDFEVPEPPSEANRDVVLFAAGAVEFTAPTDWQVREIAVAREMRLLVTPPVSGNSPGQMIDGVWFTYHAAPRDSTPTAREVASFLASRMTNLIGNRGTTSAVKTAAVQSWPGARQEFVLPPSANNPSGSRGFHVVIGTNWGFCEIHAESPNAELPQRNSDIQQMLRTLVLGEPQNHQVPSNPETQDAAAALGTWKAFRSRMKLFGDGRILLIQDTTLNQPLDQAPHAKVSDKQRLSGRFQARQDVLHVTWADGSKQNFRWRVQANSLLLTDHEGQTNHLKRTYE